MGQYYNPVLIQRGRIKVYDRSVKPEKEYVMAKLTEHSWWFNPTCNAVAKLLYKKAGYLFWCGDYAEDAIAEFARNVSNEYSLPNPEGFNLNNKFLVNWTDKTYIDCNKYYDASKDEDGWVLFPLSLLTARGNGLGGGDYHGCNMDLVGTWAGKQISVEDEKPVGYNEQELVFMER